MPADPDLQALLDDLRNGYGDARPAVVEPVAPAPRKSARARDWEMRTKARP